MSNTQKIAVIDYAGGNLASAGRALEEAGRRCGEAVTITITDNPTIIRQADRLVLPGQGAFADCMHGLRARPDLLRALIDTVYKGRPFLGICVGMQIMAQAGFEDENCTGLGWIKGEIRKIPTTTLPLPQMGWNDLSIHHAHPLVEGLGHDPNVYFVHSYALTHGQEEDCIATTHYGTALPALVCRGNVAGTQFHTEKSQEVGLKILANFLQWTPRERLKPHGSTHHHRQDQLS